MPAWVRIVARRPRQWITDRPTITAVATASSAGRAAASSPAGASRYFPAAEAEAAIGPPKPIRNETQPDKNPADGP